VTPILGRVGQQVRNNLQYGLTGGGGAAPPRYRLDVGIIASRTSSIVDAKSDEPQIDTVLITGTFSLVDLSTNKVVLAGRNNARKSFDRTLERFGALRAARDAENSAATLLAEQIRNRVAIHLAEQS
jgi:LPS-assembly lipoprotein